MSSALVPKVSFFGELTFTARTDAGTGAPAAPVSTPRSNGSSCATTPTIIFKLSFGRYHTPINYWNTAFHHGQWLQTTISRPEMTQFGGSFIPVHFIGALVEGRRAGGRIESELQRRRRQRPRADHQPRRRCRRYQQQSRVAGERSSSGPTWLYGLQIGGSVYRDALNPLAASGRGSGSNRRTSSGRRRHPELIAEFANVTHQPIGRRPIATARRGTCRRPTGCPGSTKRGSRITASNRSTSRGRTAIFRARADIHRLDSGVRYDFSALRGVQDRVPLLLAPRFAADPRHLRADELYVLGGRHAKLTQLLSTRRAWLLAAGRRACCHGARAVRRRCDRRPPGCARGQSDLRGAAPADAGGPAVLVFQSKVTLLVRAPGAREREVVLKTIYQMSEAQFRQYWIAKVFRAEAAQRPPGSYTQTKWRRNWWSGDSGRGSVRGCGAGSQGIESAQDQRPAPGQPRDIRCVKDGG